MADVNPLNNVVLDFKDGESVKVTITTPKDGGDIAYEFVFVPEEYSLRRGNDWSISGVIIMEWQGQTIIRHDYLQLKYIKSWVPLKNK
jgi:hypothetical protein